MTTHDSQRTTDDTKNGSSRRGAMKQAADASTTPVKLTRRGMIQTTAGLSAAAAGVGTLSSGAAANLADGEFQRLSVDSDNRIVNEDGEVFRMRGVNIPDPKRLEVTKHLRGKDGEQLLNLVTNNEMGWYPRVVRLPAQPQDIGEHPMGHTGPEYEDGELESEHVVADDRRKMRPPQPEAFDRNDLEDYFDNYYEPLVQQCADRGVYCIIDYHRHWHEQPPGDPDLSDAAAENHLPYNSDYTNYWARNVYDDTRNGIHISFTEDDPGSWGHVDQTWIDAHGYGEYGDGNSPYTYESWQVNEDLLSEALMFWEMAGERFGHMDHVIFEPYNEPTSPGIWGPVTGCGADKQHGLWDTFVDDFMGPILDTCREYYDGLMLVGVPGWCQSLQGLHWRDFNDAGYEDIACTWHNYAGHDVSQMHNWFNDTDYKSPGGVEAETGESLDDPYLPPPDPSEVDDPDCWGWEGYEAAGLQGAMDYHPIAVTEFGWIDSEEVSHWLRGDATGNGTTNYYGEPFFEEIEQDPRISWVAWVADVRWFPTMFEYEDGANEGDLDLTNDNFYDASDDEIPEPCPNLPCEWELMGNPHSGDYIKGQLEEHRTDNVPFDLIDHGEGSNTGDGCDDLPTAMVDGQTVCDVSGDSLYRDVTADGEVGQDDVVEFFENQHRDAWKQPELFDFSGSDSVGHGDVVALFEDVSL